MDYLVRMLYQLLADLQENKTPVNHKHLQIIVLLYIVEKKYIYTTLCTSHYYYYVNIVDNCYL